MYSEMRFSHGASFWVAVSLLIHSIPGSKAMHKHSHKEPETHEYVIMFQINSCMQCGQTSFVFGSL